MATKQEILNSCTKQVKSSKMEGKNTLRIEYADGSVSIRLNDTDIVTRDIKGNIILNSGKWKTRVTRKKICLYGAVNIFKQKGIWFISCKNKKGEDISTEFYDGITFTSDMVLLSQEIKSINQHNINLKLTKV